MAGNYTAHHFVRYSTVFKTHTRQAEKQANEIFVTMEFNENFCILAVFDRHLSNTYTDTQQIYTLWCRTVEIGQLRHFYMVGEKL